MANRPAAAGHPRLRRWRKQALIALAVVAFLVGIYLIGRAFLPRWWAHRIGDQVNGSIAAGIALGVFYGFVFTLLPVLVLWWGLRRRRPWRHALAYAVGAILLAAPNLVTLAIVLGTGNAAHAGERTLDVEAPAYRTSVLVGALTGVAVLAVFYYLLYSRRLARGRVAKLRARLRAGEGERDEAPAEAPPEDGASAGPGSAAG